MRFKVNDLTSTSQQHAVSFSARAYENKALQPWDILLFPDVEHNHGGAFNKTSGQFVAPVSGTYVFFCNILTNKETFLEMGLMVKDNIKLLIFATGESNYGNGSNMLIIHLDKGDEVKVVKYGPWGSKPFYVHNTFTTFSGFLLYEA